MSLITLNSNGQTPHLFSCHFPQAIKIKPNSQVCLLKFLHFRDSNVFNITSSNNRLVFLIGTTIQDAFRIVNIPIGQYRGEDLATIIETEMNAVLQQQIYLWSCVYTPEDPTTSPPTIETFTILLYAVVTPPASVPVFAISNPTVFRQDGEQLLIQTAEIGNVVTDGRFLEPKGILINDGEIVMDNIPFDYNQFFDGNIDQDMTFTFNNTTMGICRDEISSLTAENINLQFNHKKQDVGISFNDLGIQISSINIKPGPSTIGEATYAEQRLCRTIPAAVLRRQLGQGAFGLNSVVNTRYRATLITKNKQRTVVITLQRSLDCGRTYLDIDPAALGVDGNTHSYIKSVTTSDGVVYPSCIWHSSDATLNDRLPNGDSLLKNNVIQTKKAPFHPTMHLAQENITMDYKEFVSGTLFYTKTAGGTAMDPTAYTGIHQYLDIWIDVGDANKQYYCVPDTVLNPTTFTDINLWHVSETDVAIVPATPLGSFTYNVETNTATIIRAAGATIVFTLDTGTSSGVPQHTAFRNRPINTGGIFNPDNRPITNMRVNNPDLSPKSREEMHRDILSGEDLSNIEGEETLGVEVQRPVTLLLKTLNNEDIANNTGNPLNLTQGILAKYSGSIGGILGSNQNLVKSVAGAFPITAFTTEGPPQKISKDTIINVSINEFSGLKSFNGIDQSVGKNLSGEGKVLAVLPREEFSTANIEKEGSLVYVAPFENWLDINNGQELLLNQLTLEVRTPAGEMATDLRPDTIAQIKIREDPHKVVEAIANNNYDRLIRAVSSATMTGQSVLNPMMSHDGS